MQGWLRNSLFVVVMLCAAIIGMRVYLELTALPVSDDGLPDAGQVAGAPEQLPDFVLNDLDGQPRNIHEWDGPLLINFWATWCAPCRREIPLLETLHKENAGIRVIGVAIDRLADVESFIGEYGVSYPNLVGMEDALAVSELFGLQGIGLPFSVLVAGDRNILTVHIGEISAGQLATLAGISSTYERGGMPLEIAREQLSAL